MLICTTLNAFNKICERCIHNSLSPLVDKFLLVSTSGYRKTSSANDLLIRFIQNWKQSLDNRKYCWYSKTDCSLI